MCSRFILCILKITNPTFLYSPSYLYRASRKLFLLKTSESSSSETQGQLVGSIKCSWWKFSVRSSRSYRKLSPRTFYRPDYLSLGLRGWILTNGKQNSGPEHSVQRSCFPCTRVPFTGKSWTTSFGRNIPTRETDLPFDDLWLPEILTWWERQVFGYFLSNFCYFCNTKSLSRLYRGLDRISISRL